MDLTNAIFTDEEAARAHFESLRWPDGVTCPHCGVVGQATAMEGKTTRKGLYNCKACRKPFTATMGTVYERSHIPLHKWLLATHLLCSSKKGMSAHQLWRMLGFGSYRTAWFMAHRIREAMTSDDTTPMGTGGGAVEVDETYIGNIKGREKAKAGAQHKYKVLSLLDRSSGRARSQVITDFNMKTVGPILEANISHEARFMTDEAPLYKGFGWNFADHGMTTHKRGEYVSRQAPSIHTNTIEGYFSIFKRGMRGVYQHCTVQHLNRYLAEFDFRYSNRIALGVDDTTRAAKAVRGTVGKRLTYRRIDSLQAA